MEIETCTDEAMLDILIRPLVQKHYAKVAKVILTFSRRDLTADGNDILIPRGFEVSTEGKNPVVFKCAETRILWKNSASVKIPAYSVDFGISQNVGAGTLTYFADKNYHDIAVTNESPAYGGQDEETTYDARKRIQQFRYARDGSVSQIESIIGEIGFTPNSYKVVEYWDGYGSVLVVLETSSDEYFKDCIEKIERKKPGGIKYHYTKVSPVYANFDVTVKVTGTRIFDEYTLDDIESSIKSAVQLYFNNSIDIGRTLSIKRLESFVLNYITGQYDIYEILIEIDQPSKYDIDDITGFIKVKPYQKIIPNKIETTTEYNVI